MISISFSEAYALFGNKNKKFKTLFISYVKKYLLYIMTW
jgi:hypothetical protein